MEPEIEDHAIIDPLLEREGKKKKKIIRAPYKYMQVRKQLFKT